MININEVNDKLVAQDEALWAIFTDVSTRLEGDPATLALAEILTEGLAAIHERQGNLITLMLRTNQ